MEPLTPMSLRRVTNSADSTWRPFVNYVMAATQKQTDTKTVQPTAHRRFQAQRGRLPCTYATVRQLYCAIHACAHPQKHHVWIRKSLPALLQFGLPEQAAR